MSRSVGSSSRCLRRCSILIVKRDVLRSAGDLLADVSEDHVALNDSELSLVNRNDGTVPADVFAASAGFGIGDLFIVTEPRVVRREIGALRREELEFFERDVRCGSAAGDRNEPGFEFAADDIGDAMRSQQLLVERCVEPVRSDASFGAADAIDHRNRQPCRGVHREKERYKISISDDRVVEFLDGEVETPYVVPLAREPRFRRRQPERLMAQIVRRDEDNSRHGYGRVR